MVEFVKDYDYVAPYLNKIPKLDLSKKFLVAKELQNIPGLNDLGKINIDISDKDVSAIEKMTDYAHETNFHEWLRNKYPDEDPNADKKYPHKLYDVMNLKRQWLLEIDKEYFDSRQNTLDFILKSHMTYKKIMITGPEHIDDLRVMYLYENDHDFKEMIDLVDDFVKETTEHVKGTRRSNVDDPPDPNLPPTLAPDITTYRRGINNVLQRIQKHDMDNENNPK